MTRFGMDQNVCFFFLEFVYFNYFQIYLFKIEGAKNRIVWFCYYLKIVLIRLAHRIVFYR